MLKKILSFITISLAIHIPLRLQAEKVIEVPLTREKWETLQTYLPKADFVRYTDKGIAILVEDEDLPLITDIGLSYTILEDLTIKKKLYYTGKNEYHTYDQMKAELIQLAQNYSSICKLDTIGFSIQNRPILSLKISDNPHLNEPEPMVRIVGAHHGNEWISAEVPFLYAKYLLENYTTDSEVRSLVNHRQIYIIPILNPDGHVVQTRQNAAGVDLNRNYGYIKYSAGTSPYSEPETRSMHEFSKSKPFNLSLSFHSGAIYVNYIWNYTPVRSADDRYNGLVVYYSQQYGNITGYPITEGYDWYQTLGDLNDYSYGINGDIDWTIEVSNSFIPQPSEIVPIFNTNKPAMNLFVRKAGQGICGFVLDAVTGDTIKNARITILPTDWPIWTDWETGYFYRPLLPGSYTLRVEAPGYYPSEIQGIIVNSDTSTHINISLNARNDLKVNLWKPEVIYINASNSVITADTFMTHYALGEPDGKYFSLGVGGYAIFDLGTQIKSESIFVYEGNDNVPNEGFKIFISNTPYGPWTQIGNVHYGSVAIATSQTFRYLKIEDDGDGSNSVRKCGYDLDAIEVKIKPDFELVSFEIYEKTGNGNGVINPDETGILEFVLRNNAPSATNSIWIKPLINDPYVSFLDDSILIETLSPNEEVICSLNFYASLDLPYDYNVNMILEIRTTRFSWQIPVSFKLNVRDSTVYAGPDLYGYYAYDSRDSIYTEFERLSFIDIEGVGTIISQITNQDDATAQITLPFNFRYYGQNFNTISVCTNGWIAMGSTSTTNMINYPIPDFQNPPALIAPYFTDLDLYSHGDVYYYYDAPAHQFIIMWKEARVWGTTQNATFQVILRDPLYYTTRTGDGEIIFVYANAPELEHLTIGIEKPDHTTGLQCYYNGSYNNTISRLTNGQFIKFTTDTPALAALEEFARIPKLNLKTTVVKRILRFSVNNPQPAKVLILDASGRILVTEEISAKKMEHSIDLKELQKGVYILRVIFPNKNVSYTEKILKIE
ncbi:MAG: M14 family zinc carboxypeptidase [candidate division WOR-3 bacterium]